MQAKRRRPVAPGGIAWRVPTGVTCAEQSRHGPVDDDAPGDGRADEHPHDGRRGRRPVAEAQVERRRRREDAEPVGTTGGALTSTLPMSAERRTKTCPDCAETVLAAARK